MLFVRKQNQNKWQRIPLKNRKVIGKERKGEPDSSSCHRFQTQISWYQTGLLILTGVTHYPAGRNEMANWFSTRLSSDTATPISNKQSLSSSEPADSLNQTQSGRIRLLTEKISSTQSHLSSELRLSCGIWGFVRAELSHSHKRRGIVGFTYAHRHTHTYSEVAAVRAPPIITASQQHVSTNGTMRASGAQLPSCCELWLSSQPVRALFLFLLLLPPLELSSSYIQSECSFTGSTHYVSAWLHRRSNQTFNPPSPGCFFFLLLLLSNPLPFSLSPPWNSSSLPLPTTSLSPLCSLAEGAWLVVTNAAGKRSQMLT